MIRLRRVLAAAGDAEASSCAGLLERVERRRLYKRAAVFPHALNAHVQDDLLHRFFSPETAGQRRAWERDRQAELRTRCGTDVEVILYCPSRTMQLKEVGTLVSFPDESDLAPLSRFRDRLPRIADLEESYLRLWKVFVLTNAETAEQRRSVQDCVRAALPDAVDAYRIR